tara:strand:- start:156 stop:608 length:453 start_codon:yes stop_codon:yes gene_type:complete
MANYVSTYKSRHFIRENSFNINKTQLTPGMFIEMRYKKTRKQLPASEKKFGTYWILVLDIRKDTDNGRKYIYALDLNEINPSVIKGMFKPFNLKTTNIQGREVKVLGMTESGKAVYNKLRKFLNTTAKESYKTFNFSAGVMSTKLIDVKF